MKRLKVILAAYACRPGEGSEPGLGWNLATQLARLHDVWVVTRSDNRPNIEAELARHPINGLKVKYYELPLWGSVLLRGPMGVQYHYYLWQLGASLYARELHKQIRFDVAHHVTYAKYWAPSLVAHLGIPVVWGPVGGGESAPARFWFTCGVRGFLYEMTRATVRWVAEWDPLVRWTASHATIAVATTSQTAMRLAKIGAKNIRVLSQVALSREDISRLLNATLPSPGQVRFVSIGRLLHFKGIALALKAFAQAELPDAEYWIIGDGPDGLRLKRLTERLGLSMCVKFFGQLPRQRVLELLRECHVLVHPSLHDSGGWVIAEAMAAGKPVICLDLGGPALQVDRQTGIKVPARSVKGTIRELGRAMQRVATDKAYREAMGKRAIEVVQEHADCEKKAELISRFYLEAVGATAVGCGD